MTCRSAVFQTQSWSYGGLTVVLRWSYDSIRGKCLELSIYKDTKKVRETLDMVSGESNRIHQNTTNKITNY